MYRKIRNYFRRQQSSLERLSTLSGEHAATLSELKSVQQENVQALRAVSSVLDELQRRHDDCENGLASTQAAIRELQASTERVGRSTSEISWAAVFNSTTASSEWLLDKAFSPGRWAVGYPYLYVLYRVLNEIQPKRILELGLGQSTRMIAQYAEAHEGTAHIVVEHDDAWIDFFSRNFRLSASTRVLKLAWDYVPHKDAEAVRVYAGFAEALDAQRFSLISIDGPLGGDMNEYARIDVLSMLPGCLEPSFVIMLDDYERDGEAHTMEEMQNALTEAGIEYARCVYSGEKDLALLCSADLSFLCTM